MNTNLLNLEQALLDKIPTVYELKNTPVTECSEEMVELTTNTNLFITTVNDEMKPYTGDRIFVREKIVQKLQLAAKYLTKLQPELILQVHYGYRHPDIQSGRYNTYFQQVLQNPNITDTEQYTHTFIAHPEVAGHPTGGAVDVTLINRVNKTLLPMGTDLQEFSEKTFTFYPFITRQEWENRRLLRNIMQQAGFSPYDGEWWHFSYGDKEWAYFNNTNAIYAPIEFIIK